MLARAIKARFGVVLAERSISTVLRRPGFRRLVVRPRHPEQDAAAQALFQAGFAGLVEAVLPEHARGKPLGIWWEDEARIGSKAR